MAGHLGKEDIVGKAEVVGAGAGAAAAARGGRKKEEEEQQQLGKGPVQGVW